MENNIPTLYILERNCFVVKSAKISTILCPFVQKFKKNNSVLCSKIVNTNLPCESMKWDIWLNI